MAQKRMFTMKIVDSDAFLDMPLSTQCLYFHLNMRADDDGFVGNPKRIQRLIGASDDDLKLLIAKRFVLCFENGVIVIKHWRMHNTIYKDRYTQTTYIDEAKTLELKENKAYTEAKKTNDNKMLTNCYQNVSTGLGLDLDIGLDIDLDIDQGLDIEKDVCTEPLVQSAKEPIEPPVIQLPLNDKSLYDITQIMIDEYAELYPNVDILSELIKMKGWLIANPTRRKTKRGIARFINSWLSKEQDSSKNQFQHQESTRAF